MSEKIPEGLRDAALEESLTVSPLNAWGVTLSTSILRRGTHNPESD